MIGKVTEIIIDDPEKENYRCRVEFTKEDDTPQYNYFSHEQVNEASTNFIDYDSDREKRKKRKAYNKKPNPNVKCAKASSPVCDIEKTPAP